MSRWKLPWRQNEHGKELLVRVVESEKRQLRDACLQWSTERGTSGSKAMGTEPGPSSTALGATAFSASHVHSGDDSSEITASRRHGRQSPAIHGWRARSSPTEWVMAFCSGSPRLHLSMLNATWSGSCPPRNMCAGFLSAPSSSSERFDVLRTHVGQGCTHKVKAGNGPVSGEVPGGCGASSETHCCLGHATSQAAQLLKSSS